MAGGRPELVVQLATALPEGRLRTHLHSVTTHSWATWTGPSDEVWELASGPSEAGEATLKRFYLEPDRVRLEPRNATMQPIFVAPHDVTIQGKVVTVIREM